MKTLTVTEVAPRFMSVLDELQRDQEEIILVRNNQKVARLVPEPPSQNAIEVLGDLYETLDDASADALSEAINISRTGKTRTLNGLKNPWAS